MNSKSHGWVNLVIASLAMVGTLPGRTQGLGLITEPLLRDLHLNRIDYAQINLWATLIGSLCAIGIGRFIDRFGSRIVLTIVSIALATVVLLMAQAHNILNLAVLITLTRGFGQSALSVVSITIVGQWFVRKNSLPMAIYTVLLSIGFMVAFPVVGSIVLKEGWRAAWASIGYALLFVLVPTAWFFVRRPSDQKEAQGTDVNQVSKFDFTLKQSLATYAFWVFGISSALYGLLASGIALFNESILAERGFDASTYYRTLVITALTALAGNFIGGWLNEKWNTGKLMGIAMLLMSGSLLALPHVRTQTHVVLYALVMGLAGGFVIVIFFSFWSRTYGRKHLGQIQGFAQTLTVVASAIGPLILAESQKITGSYAFIFYLLSAIVFVFGFLAWICPIPKTATVT